MKVIAFTRLHYGVDYLASVLKSTEGFAQEHIILYTPSSSHGFNGTQAPCPDSRESLQAIARAAGERVKWVDSAYYDIHIGTVVAMHPDADLVLELDGDEVITPQLFESLIEAIPTLDRRAYRLQMVHHWRNFGHICRDSGYPVRAYLPKNNGDEAQYFPNDNGLIHHFGYARSIPDTAYKLKLSAHRDEFRANWWNEVFMQFPDRLTDLHPVCVDGFWNAEEFDRHSLPEFMHDHPYFDMEAIE